MVLFTNWLTGKDAHLTQEHKMRILKWLGKLLTNAGLWLTIYASSQDAIKNRRMLERQAQIGKN